MQPDQYFSKIIVAIAQKTNYRTTKIEVAKLFKSLLKYPGARDNSGLD